MTARRIALIDHFLSCSGDFNLVGLAHLADVVASRDVELFAAGIHDERQ